MKKRLTKSVSREILSSYEGASLEELADKILSIRNTFPQWDVKSTTLEPETECDYGDYSACLMVTIIFTRYETDEEEAARDESNLKRAATMARKLAEKEAYTVIKEKRLLKELKEKYDE